ncbi:MAG: PASTA domain-containing protein [Lachnospiraceae bacterium]|nr:PASTA domain-containing protein [Ruminococcus sp.]MCM1273758.1 PASTA domain-containing protein [Lachnospiraceae bacterium]
MLKDTSLCMGCMNDKTYDGPCRLCGYSELDPCIPTYLEPKTYLNDRYIVGRLLSYNGEGAIYIGYDTAAGSKVTIKEFMPDTLCTRKKGETAVAVNPNSSALYKTYLSEFEDLNRSLMKLRGMAHIQAVLDVFSENNTCYAVFEFINGISLKTYLANSSGGLAWEQVKELFPPILTTLSLVHSAGIIHRGISPQTIFVTDKMELKLAGFCISAARTTNTEIACEIFSGYAAPEQYSNEINGTWTDVYGISAVLYKVLTGTAPTEAIARTGSSMLEPVLVNRNVPQNVSKVIMHGMKLATEGRIRSITEFVDKLFAPPRYTPGRPNDDGKPLTQREQKRLKKQKKERAKFLAVIIFVGIVLITFALAFSLTLTGTCTFGNESTLSDGSDESSSVVSSSSSSSSSSTSSSSSRTEYSVPESSVNEANIELPDFTNRRYEDTAARYEGIFTFVPTYVYSDEYPFGFMFGQTIEAGTMVAQGTQIEITVSKGRSVVPLPDYNGKTQAEYIAALTSLNVKYEVVAEQTGDVPAGYVVRCNKAVSDLIRVSEGETVTVYVAEAPNTGNNGQ